MLLLSRREGQRVRLQAPCGKTAWVTMGIDCFELDSGLRGQDLTIRLGDHYARIVYTPSTVRVQTGRPQRRPGIGIEADRAVEILREELINPANGGRI